MLNSRARLIFSVLRILSILNLTYATDESDDDHLSECTAYHPTDVLCNNDTQDYRTFACVCYTADLSLSNAYPECFSFVISDTIPALRLILTSTNGLGNLESLSKQSVPLSGVRISYEYYFKRRVSNIISNYCSDESHHCQSISRSLHPSNVLILRLSCFEDDRKRFIMDYTILKNAEEPQNLTEMSVIEPGLILAALKPKLQKTIPYTIVDHQPHSIELTNGEQEKDQNKWKRLWKENIGFITALIIVAALIVIVYIIAILKALRDRSKRQERSPTAKKATNGVHEKSTHYGAMDENLLSNSPTEKIGSPEHKDFFFTMIKEETEEKIVSDPRANGSFAYSPPTPPTALRKINYETDDSPDDFHPQPPTPSPKLEEPVPVKRSIIANVTSSQSMQLQNPKKKSDDLESTTVAGGVKKATTFQYFGDGSTRKSIVSSTINSEPPTPPSLILDEDKNEETFATPMSGDEKPGSQGTGESDRSGASTVIQVPVLIVPAMGKSRNDNDFDNDKNYDEQFETPVEEKSVTFDRRNGNSDSEVRERHRREKRNPKPGPSTIRTALSEELLIPRDSTGNALIPSFDQQISSVSDDTGNSDAEGNLDPGGFQLLMSGIGYQPLRESNWSMTALNDEDYEDNENNN